ncbi:MAG: hypothetical protein FJ088_05220, partial [Deltaproteobacteria bacterium]|nr:hypothetical protein [Deltaproteobacteria bacterium]
EDLLIYGIKFYQVPDSVGNEPVGPFRIQILEDSYSTLDAKTGVKFEKPLVIKSNQSIPVGVKYSPTIPDPIEATIRFFTNDPLYPEPDGYEVTLLANVGGPCISLVPPSLEFGGVVITNLSAMKTEIKNCGDSPLEIYSIELSTDSSKDFGLDKTQIPGYATISKEKPLILQSGSKAILIVKYFPEEVKKDTQGKIVEDQGRVLIENNSFSQTVEVPLNGTAIGSDCPVADFIMYDGAKQLNDKDTVKVMTQIKLKNTSYDPNPLGGIAYYEWSVEQPPDATFKFTPSNQWPDPTFPLNVSGAYTFRLKVINKNGIPSCNVAEKTVFSKSGEGIHIELTWTTPNDPNQTDECPECGSDLDVHFVHPYAAGQDLDKDGKPDGYFDCPDIVYDAFWFNPHPHWVEGGNPATQDPNLDLDDTNGLGPENMRLNEPEEGTTYKVGAHYWNDHGFGISYATIKIYINGELKWKKEKVKMMNLDMWDAALIKWKGNAAEITEILDKGATKIIKNYIPTCLYI